MEFWNEGVGVDSAVDDEDGIDGLDNCGECFRGIVNCLDRRATPVEQALPLAAGRATAGRLTIL